MAASDLIEAKISNIMTCVADSAPVMIWITDAKKSVRYFNRDWLEFTGRTLEQELSDDWGAGIHPDDRRVCRDIFDAAFEARREFRLEFRLRRLDGEYIWMMGRGTPLYSSRNRFIGYIGSCVDIHTHKMAESYLRDSLNARDRLFSMASHELRTPLTALYMQLQVLKKTHSTAAGDATTARIDEALNQTKSFAGLIDTMLDATHISTGKLQLNLETFDLSEVLAKIVDDLRGRKEYRGVDIRVQRPEHLNVRLDRPRIKKIIVTLLTNALKFGERKPVTIRLSEDRAVVRICVNDRGSGLTQEARDRISERYEKIEKVAEASGLGLGLILSRQIAEAHHGHISVQSDRHGSTFTVLLPVELHMEEDDAGESYSHSGG